MFKAEVDTDVLIVGAGPVGLFLANECARRGLRFRLVEAHASQSTYSKARAIFPRTIEILDMAGLVGPFLEQANRVTSVAIVWHGRESSRMRFAPKETPYPFIAMVPQNVTEQLLVTQLRGSGGKRRIRDQVRFPQLSTTITSASRWTVISMTRYAGVRASAVDFCSRVLTLKRARRERRYSDSSTSSAT